MDSMITNSDCSSFSWRFGAFHLKCMTSHVLSPLLWPLLYHFFASRQRWVCSQTCCHVCYINICEESSKFSKPIGCRYNITNSQNVTLEWLYLTFLSFQNYLVWMKKVAVNTFLMSHKFLFFLSQEQLLSLLTVFVLKIKEPKETDILQKTFKKSN